VCRTPKGNPVRSQQGRRQPAGSFLHDPSSVPKASPPRVHARRKALCWLAGRIAPSHIPGASPPGAAASRYTHQAPPEGTKGCDLRCEASAQVQWQLTHLERLEPRQQRRVGPKGRVQQRWRSRHQSRLSARVAAFCQQLRANFPGSLFLTRRYLYWDCRSDNTPITVANIPTSRATATLAVGATGYWQSQPPDPPTSGSAAAAAAPGIHSQPGTMICADLFF